MPYDRVALVIIKGVVGAIPTISSITKHKSASWSLLDQDTTFYKLMFCDEIYGTNADIEQINEFYHAENDNCIKNTDSLFGE